MIGSRFGNTEGKGDERPDISKVQSQSASDIAARRATRRGSIDMNEVQKKQMNLEMNEKQVGSKGYSAAELDILQFGNVSKARNVAAFGESKNKDLYLGFVWAKFPLEKTWKRYYARVQNS